MSKLILFVTALIALAAHAPGASAPREESVAFRNGDTPLAGALLFPAADAPLPAVVIVSGSGESDRTNPWTRAVAEQFLESGMAVLIADKRGSGQSGGDWRTAGFEELAADALAALRYLATRDEIDASRIGLAGLSQGGRVVPVAAASSPDVAFAINIVGDAVSFAEQSAHEMNNIARQAGLPDPLRREVVELNGAAGRALLTGDWTDYVRLREVGLQSPWAPIAQGFPPAGDPIWTFYRKSIAFDPMPYWVLVRQPSLILYGAEDERDNVAVSESVRRLEFGFGQAGKTNYEITVIPDVGHALGWTREQGLGDAAKAAIRIWLRENVAPSAAASAE